MKKALLVLAVAFAGLQAAQPASAQWFGGGPGYGGPANYMNMGGPGYGYGGPGMYGGNRMGYFGNPGFMGYHRCYHHRHWRRW
jgi:hypothetical protein